MKRCSKCELEKPLDAFGLHQGRRRPDCLECVNQAQKNRDERRRAAVDARRTESSLTSLLPFATEFQRQCINALLRCGSVDKAAQELDLPEARLRAYLTETERRAATRGWLPDGAAPTDLTAFAPPGFHVKGTSTLLRADGSIAGQWVKTQADQESRLAQLADAAQALADDFRGLADPIATPSHTDDDLLCVYPMGDPHFGMLAWGLETGENFDLKIAEADLLGAVDALVSIAPLAKRALIIELGDFFHADNSTNQTLRSHHALDVDGRWSKILRVGVKAMRRVIDRALQRHEIVDVIIAIGNHDDHSAQMLAIVLSAYYENEPRVRINTEPSKFHWYEFGANLIGVTHGDTVKYGDLLGVMAHDRAEAWGRTLHRRWYCGHVHHDQTKELPGVIVETFRTLAARDAWHHSKGYRAGRDMKLDVVHRLDGWINRHTIGLPKIRRMQEQAQ